MGTVETAPDERGLRAVLDRLKGLGWTEGATARIDVRWSRSDLALMRENAQALLALSPDVVLCHSNPALAQLQPLAANTPIVFVMVADPVGSGFVQSWRDRAATLPGSLISNRRWVASGFRY
jgi:putative ABC transport system substrate-binding protein